MNQLTPRQQRQKEIIDLRLDGLYYKEIARKLGVSYSTVSNDIRRVYDNLNICNMRQLRAWVHEQERAQEADIKLEYKIALREGGYYACFPEKEQAS